MARYSKITVVILLVVAALTTAPSTAFACTPQLLPPMTPKEKAAFEQRQIDDFLARARDAKAIVEIRAVSSSGINYSSALIEVRRVLDGKARRGKILRLKTVGSSLCGAGELQRGERGVIFLTKGRQRTFDGFLNDRQIELLRSEGLVP